MIPVPVLLLKHPIISVRGGRLRLHGCAAAARDYRSGGGDLGVMAVVTLVSSERPSCSHRRRGFPRSGRRRRRPLPATPCDHPRRRRLCRPRSRSCHRHRRRRRRNHRRGRRPRRRTRGRRAAPEIDFVSASRIIASQRIEENHSSPKSATTGKWSDAACASSVFTTNASCALAAIPSEPNT